MGVGPSYALAGRGLQLGPTPTNSLDDRVFAKKLSANVSNEECIGHFIELMADDKTENLVALNVASVGVLHNLVENLILGIAEIGDRNIFEAVGIRAIGVVACCSKADVSVELITVLQYVNACTAATLVVGRYTPTFNFNPSLNVVECIDNIMCHSYWLNRDVEG